MLWSETKHEALSPDRLRGTRGLPLVRFKNFLSSEEFSKLAVLMRDLAPSVIVLMKPQNESRIRSTEWSAVRENLLLVLNGDSAATPLF
jgi:hypothetical protein